MWRQQPTDTVGKWTKVPYRADAPSRKASSTDPATWSTFAAAFAAYEQHPDLSGVGLVLNGDGLAGLDLDHCTDADGAVAPWATEILAMLPGAYVERSPSGTGLRALFRATLPPGRRKKNRPDGGVVELYDTARFLTITGHAVNAVDTLPALDEEVARLHALVMPGDAAAGDAFSTTLTGAASTVLPEDLDILTAMLSGRRGDVLARVWAGDCSDFGGDESAADLSLANALAFYCAKDADRIERIMRAGPYRPKWDTARGSTTWLGLTIGKAIAGTANVYRPSAAGATGVEIEGGWFSPPEQTIARLQRDLADARALVATQQTILREAHARREAAEVKERAALETIQRIGDVLAIPTERLAPAPKILTIVTIMEAHSRASRGKGALPAAALEERSGLSKNTVSAFMQDVAAREGSPITRRLTRDWVTDDSGNTAPITVSLVTPRFETVNESLAAVLTMGERSQQAKEKAAAKRARERERERLQVPFGRCSECDNDYVSVTGSCPRHREIVGETLVRREDFALLDPHPAPNGPTLLFDEAEDLNHNRRDSDANTPPSVDVRTKRHNRRESDGPTSDQDDDRPAEDLNHAAHDSEPTPIRPRPTDPACVHCPEPVIPGGTLWCAFHQSEADKTVMPWERAAAGVS